MYYRYQAWSEGVAVTGCRPQGDAVGADYPGARHTKT